MSQNDDIVMGQWTWTNQPVDRYLVIFITHLLPSLGSCGSTTGRKRSLRTPDLIWTQAALIQTASRACALQISCGLRQLCCRSQAQLAHSRLRVGSASPDTNRKRSLRTPDLMWARPALIQTASVACALQLLGCHTSVAIICGAGTLRRDHRRP